MQQALRYLVRVKEFAVVRHRVEQVRDDLDQQLRLTHAVPADQHVGARVTRDVDQVVERVQATNLTLNNLKRPDLVVATVASFGAEADSRAVNGVDAVHTERTILLKFRLDRRRVHRQTISDELGHQRSEVVTLEFRAQSWVRLPAAVCEEVLQVADAVLVRAARMRVAVT